MGDRGDTAVGADHPELIEIDCLRGLAITLVLATHTLGTVYWLAPAPTEVPFWQVFGYAGRTGVTLFFVLSAFLLSRPFLARVHDGRPLGVRRYAIRRVLRIMPLYAASVVVAVVVTSGR